MQKVKYLKVHQDLFIPGFGSLGNTMPPHGKTLQGLEMFLTADGYYIKAEGAHAIIPPANVYIAVLEEPYEEFQE